MCFFSFYVFCDKYVAHGDTYRTWHTLSFIVGSWVCYRTPRAKIFRIYRCSLYRSCDVVSYNLGERALRPQSKHVKSFTIAKRGQETLKVGNTSDRSDPYILTSTICEFQGRRIPGLYDLHRIDCVAGWESHMAWTV